MHILWLATKPPWPPRDGGRLVQWLTLEALAAQGVRLTVVAPRGVGGGAGDEEAVTRVGAFGALHLVEARPRPLPLALLRAWWTGKPLAVVRHELEAVRRRVGGLLEAPAAAEALGPAGAPPPIDVLHAEQLHAWAQTSPAPAAGLPRVLRAQNVESDLWAAVARRGGPRGALAARQARALARAEGAAVGEAQVTVALTPEDAARLEDLSGGASVEVIPPPFPATLPAGSRPLRGTPPVILLGSGGWLPNRDAEVWFLRDIWPGVASRMRGAVLHVFGGTASHREGGERGDAIEVHPAPADSREAFPTGGVLVVPLRIASGIRMKVLEAWARGVPVVATPEAAAGLGAEDGRELLLARDAGEYTSALLRLVNERGLSERLVQAGRRALEERHDPRAIGERWVEVYRRAGQRR